MSNYNLDARPGARNDLYNAAMSLLNRNVYLHQAYCPLTFDQAFNAVTTADDRAAWDHLKKRKYYVPTNHRISAWVNGPDMTVPTKIQLRASGLPYQEREDHFFDLDTLDDATRRKFVPWLNALTREKRKATAAIKVAKEFVFGRCGTSIASMHRRWPEFMLVLTSTYEPWPTRARNLPRVHLKQYEWSSNHDDYNWFLENMKRIEVISGMLAGATLVKPIDDDKSPIRVEVTEWKKPVVQEAS